MIIYNKTRQHFFVSVLRQTFLGFEKTSNFRDTFPLRGDLQQQNNTPSPNKQCNCRLSGSSENKAFERCRSNVILLCHHRLHGFKSRQDFIRGVSGPRKGVIVVVATRTEYEFQCYLYVLFFAWASNIYCGPKRCS